MTLTSEQDRVFAWPAGDRDHYYATPNPASEPAKCGLEIIDDLHDHYTDGYNTIIAWRDLETSKVYIAHDSGCSCPTPFEEFKRLLDLTPVTNTLDAQAFVSNQNIERSDGGPTFSLLDVLRFLAKIDAALRGEALAAA